MRIATTSRGVSAFVANRQVGQVVFELDEDRRRFVNRPSGYISPAMVRATLDAAERFGQQFPDGWAYVVVTGVILPDPRNAAQLSRIPDLANIESYIVVAKNPIMRALAHVLRPISHPDKIQKTL